MKKSTKVILIVTAVLVGIILLDTLQARIFKHSPFISWKEELSDSDSWVDKGILIDTFYCVKEQDIITVSWHFKTSKFTCPTDNIALDKLNIVNNKIIEYFSFENAEYNNLLFNYVDEENKVVVVGLLNNSKEEQNKFKKTVIDSPFINFVSGESNVDHIAIEDELSSIQDRLMDRLSLKEDYTNFAACSVDKENLVVVVTLIDNSKEEQEWFKKNIIDSKYIKFVQGGPYTTSE